MKTFFKFWTVYGFVAFFVPLVINILGVFDVSLNEWFAESISISRTLFFTLIFWSVAGFVAVGSEIIRQYKTKLAFGSCQFFDSYTQQGQAVVRFKLNIINKTDNSFHIDSYVIKGIGKPFKPRRGQDIISPKSTFVIDFAEGLGVPVGTSKITLGINFTDGTTISHVISF